MEYKLIQNSHHSEGNWSIEQQALQVELDAIGREYLDEKSYVDCSKFIARDSSDIKEKLLNRPEAIIGNVSKPDLEMILDTLKNAPTINGKLKKRYGIYDFKVD